MFYLKNRRHDPTFVEAIALFRIFYLFISPSGFCWLSLKFIVVGAINRIDYLGNDKIVINIVNKSNITLPICFSLCAICYHWCAMTKINNSEFTRNFVERYGMQ